MLGKIEKIVNNEIYLKLAIDVTTTQSLLNLFVLMQDNTSSYIGEIVNIADGIALINLLGEFKDNSLIYGFIKKPAFNAKVNLISPNFVPNLISFTDPNSSVLLGESPFYDKIPISANLNALFGSHLAIFGSSGSGKSCGFTRLMQNLMQKPNISPNMNLIIFDAYGEYHDAFNYLNNTQKYAFKSYSTSQKNNQEDLCIPPWLMDEDDYALLLDVQKTGQISIIQKALRNVYLFKKPSDEVKQYKNSIIASAMLDILLSGRPAPQIRDQFFSALSKFNTEDLNLESTISQPGYTRTLRQCLIIDDNNKINAIELITSFLSSFLRDEIISDMPDGSFEYTLEDFSNGLDFALIDEGVWKSEKIFDDANILKVRLTNLMNSNLRKIFEYPTYISKGQYIDHLFTTMQGKKAQIINFSLDSLDDRMAKTIVKIFSKLFFNYAKNLPEKASKPFNIFLEEAHRYVQNDNDVNILGYNIFERIAKEGRKYGVLIGLISQRPCELSTTCLSQCNNFLLFKMSHPSDIEFIEKIIPNITEQIIERVKTVKPGFALAFGNAVNIPTLVKFAMPDPSPNSDSCKLSSLWFE